MATGGLCYLAGQVVSENEVCSTQTSPRGAGNRRSLEEALTALRKGALLLKHGRHGKPKVHFFRLTACDTLLRWRGASGSIKQVRLRNVSEVVAGQTTEVFRRCPLRASARCLSLRYRDEDGTTRTLDLTCADEQQYELWLTGLRVVAERLRTLGTPVVVPAGAAGAAAAPGTVLGAGAGAGGVPPAELVRSLTSRVALQRTASGPLAVTAIERVPCDLLAWGAAQRAPPTAMSLRSVLGVSEDCWQRRSMPGLAPGAAQLDAYRAAVGRKHAAVVTATGALYTWGEGRGGKLGLGHDLDHAQPQRVRHGLEGQCVVAVACGDDCTAALTEAGDLFMWGRLHADSPPQLVPLHVRGELRGRRVVQMSCGPFHCAAVTADGGLFTWGEGFGGKLGHGDQGSRAQPMQVASFAGRQVLQVACGVWHTAAVVAEPEGGSPYHGGLAGLQHSPLRHEGSASAGPDTLAGFDPSMPGGVAPGIPPASPVHHGASHHRNNSTSSAFSEASVFHDGTGGTLYTWGGVNESVAFGSSEKHDSNKGCLGHGEVDLYRGQLLPVRVGGALENKQVRTIAAGSHLTIAITTGGRVFQMGVTGASGPVKNCPWEGATLPEPVRGALQGYFIDEVSCGMHHAVALGRPVDRKTGRPAPDPAPRAVFAWGRGSEGQLGVSRFEDSAAPLAVDGLKGRPVLQVTCGGSNSMAVCEHNTGRWEPDSKEEAEAASKALYALTSDTKPQRYQEDALGPLGVGRRESERVSGNGNGSGGVGGIVRRSLSMMVSRSGASHMPAGGGNGGPPAPAPPSNLARTSTSSVRSAGGASAAGSGRGGPSGPPSAAPLVYSLGGGYRSQTHLGRESQQHGPSALAHRPSLQRVRSDRTGSGALGSDYGSVHSGHGAGHRVLSIGSPVKGVSQSYSAGSGFGRRATYAGAGALPASHGSSLAGGAGGGAGMVSARSFTALSGGGAPSFGRASDRSSMSSLHHTRALSDDGRGHDHDAAGNAQRTLSNSDLAAGLDDQRSITSASALHDELVEKNHMIERLQRRLEKMEAQARQQAGPGPAPAPAAGTDAEARLRESVQASAGAFRAAQQAGASAGAGRQQRGTSGARWESRPSSRPTTPTGLLGALRGPASIPEEDQAAQLTAMEQLLAKKEAHLEGQQQRLAAWAAELHRRELALAQQKARAEMRLPRSSAGSAGPAGGDAGGVHAAPAGAQHTVRFATPGHSPAVGPPIPCESPEIAGRLAAATGAAGSRPGSASAAPRAVPASPLVRRAIEGTGAATPTNTGSGTMGQAGSEDSGGAATPSTPALPGEWQEEFEQGVHLTFVVEGGVTKLKRIRFSRSLFSAEGAKQWYEANKHLLAQPTSTPRLAGSGPATAGSGSLGSSSQPGTPAALPAGGQQAPPMAQGPAHAVQQPTERGAAGAVGTAGAAASLEAGGLHYRQTSRNLSFDARELASFHERLQALAAQQQQGQGQHGHSSAAPGLPPQHRPSRLSQVSRPVVAPGSDVPAAESPSAAGAAAVLPQSPFASRPVQSPEEQALKQQQEEEEQQQLDASQPSEPADDGAAADDGSASEQAAVAVLGGVEAEASRPFLSAQSSPRSQPLPDSQTSSPSPAELDAELSALRSSCELLASHSLSRLDSGSCSSSPIRASGGSRASSPLSKQRSTASSLGKQLSSSSAGADLGKAAVVQQAQQAQQARDKAAGAVAIHSRSNSLQGGAADGGSAHGGKAEPPSPSGSGGALGRLRRSLTGTKK